MTEQVPVCNGWYFSQLPHTEGVSQLLSIGEAIIVRVLVTEDIIPELRKNNVYYIR